MQIVKDKITLEELQKKWQARCLVVLVKAVDSIINIVNSLVSR